MKASELFNDTRGIVGIVISGAIRNINHFRNLALTRAYPMKRVEAKIGELL